MNTRESEIWAKFSTPINRDVVDLSLETSWKSMKDREMLFGFVC